MSGATTMQIGRYSTLISIVTMADKVLLYSGAYGAHPHPHWWKKSKEQQNIFATQYTG